MRINFFSDSEAETPPFSEEVQESEEFGTNVTVDAETGDDSMYATVARWIVLVTAGLVPVFFLPFGGSLLELNKQMLLVIASGAALIVWLLGIVISGKLSIRFNPMDKGVAALMLGTLGATVFSIAQQKSLFGVGAGVSDSFVTVLALSIFYFVSVNVFDDRGKLLQKVLGVSIVVSLLFGLAQILTFYVVSASFAHTRTFNAVGTINALGLLAAISLPFFMKVRILIAGNRYLDVAKLGALVAVALLSILNWWVLWVVAIVGLLVTIAIDSISFSESGRRFKVSRFLIPMTVIVFAVFLLIVKFNFTPVKSNLPVDIAPSYSLTTQVAKKVLQERLVFGYGPENFIIAFDKFGASKLSNTNVSNFRFLDSTAQIFDWIVQGGVLMVLALLLFFWSLVESLIKSRKQTDLQTDSTSTDSSQYSGIVSCLIAFTAALFLYPFSTTLLFVFYAVLALFVLAIWGDRKRTVNIEDKPIISLASSIGFIVGLILVLAGSYFCGIHYLSDVSFAKALQSGDSKVQIDGLVQAINLNNQDDRYYRSISQATLKLLATDINKKADPGDTQRASRIQNYLANAVNFAKQATVLSPEEVTNWYNLALVYQNLIGLIDGADKLAEDSYLKAVERRPNDSFYYNQLGQMFLSESDLFRQLARSAGNSSSRFIDAAVDALNKSEKYFKQAVDISNSYGLAIYNLGAVYDRQGRLNDAIKQLETVIPYNASQPSLFFELGLLYYRANRKVDALSALQRAVLLAPQYANARWYLGLLYEEKNDFPSAIQQMKSILETNQNNQMVLDKLAQLEKGLVITPPEKVTDKKPLESDTQ